LTAFRSRLKRFEKPLIVLLLCVGGVILLKWVVVAGYTIPTPSMEPTLIGHPENGDRIAVFKLYYKLFSPSRYDLAVFFKKGVASSEAGLLERPGGTYFVKRVVGLPGESILIKDGDLYIGGATHPHRKSLPALLSMLVPVYRAEFDERFFDDWKEFSTDEGQRFTLQGGALLCRSLSAPADLVYVPRGGAIHDDYLTGDGRKHEGKHVVNDIALDLEVEFLQESGVIYGELREGSDTFRFVLYAQGGGQVKHLEGQTVGKRIDVPDFPGFRPGGRYGVRFMNIDNTILLMVDDEVIVNWEYARNTYMYSHEPNNIPLIGARAADVLFHKIEIARDIFYTSDVGHDAVEEPREVPEGHYFLLGDNSAESEDSRVFGPIADEDLVGKPFMIFRPFSRFRFL
jgi:signal peptidase I